MPGLIVIAPYDAADAKGLLKAAIRSEDPVVFLENELVYGRSFERAQLDDYVLPIGKARIVREGKDVTIVVLFDRRRRSRSKPPRRWPGEGIDAEVIDLRTLRPLDTRDGAREPRQDQPPGRRGRRLAGLLDRLGDRRGRAWRRASTTSTRRCCA